MAGSLEARYHRNISRYAIVYSIIVILFSGLFWSIFTANPAINLLSDFFQLIFKPYFLLMLYSMCMKLGQNENHPLNNGDYSTQGTMQCFTNSNKRFAMVFWKESS